MPQPYSANIPNNHVDGTEIIFAAILNLIATHIDQLEVDANAGGPLDLPTHKLTATGDHDGRYVQLSQLAASQLPYNVQPFFPAPQASEISSRIYIPWATTLTNFRAFRPDGTSASVDLLKNGVSMLSAPLSLTSASTWMPATLSTTSLAAGDVLTVTLSTTGSPTEIETSIEGYRALLAW